MSYKSSYPENPVGPEAPSFTFPFSKVQVLVALLLVAMGLTAWKQYEADTIAPRTVVRWQSFSVEAIEKAAHRHVDVLVVLDPVDPDEVINLNVRLTSAEFQKAVFVARPLPIRIESITSLDEASAGWLDDQVGSLSPGNIIWFPQGNLLNYRVFSAAEFDKVLQSLTSED